MLNPITRALGVAVAVSAFVFAPATLAQDPTVSPRTVNTVEDDDGFDWGLLGLLGLAGLAGLKRRDDDRHVGTTNRA